MSRYFILGPDGKTPKLSTIDEWHDFKRKNNMVFASEQVGFLEVIAFFYGWVIDWTYPHRPHVFSVGIIDSKEIYYDCRKFNDYNSAMAAHAFQVARLKRGLAAADDLMETVLRPE